MASFKQAADRNRRRARGLPVLVQVALEAQAEIIVSKAHQLSGGITSQAVFDAALGVGTSPHTGRAFDVRVHGSSVGLNHPYGYGPKNSRGPRGPIPNGGDPGIVNFQSGRFFFAWQSIVVYDSTSPRIVIFNDSPEAKFMGGTKAMIRRPIDDRLYILCSPGFYAALASAQRKALQLN